MARGMERPDSIKTAKSPRFNEKIFMNNLVEIEKTNEKFGISEHYKILVLKIISKL